MALSTLTDGVYDPLAGEFRSRLGDLKHYVATDHLDSPDYAALTPDDLLDVVAERHLGWDAERETGVALHMVSALAVAGRIGLTAIGDTPPEARALYYELKQTLDGVASEAAGRSARPASCQVTGCYLARPAARARRARAAAPRTGTRPAGSRRRRRSPAPAVGRRSRR